MCNRCVVFRSKPPRVIKTVTPVAEAQIAPLVAQVEKTEPSPKSMSPKPTSEPEAKSKPKTEPPKPKERVREPEFILKLRDKSAVEGSSIRLACRAMGTPEPTFLWYKDGQPISAGGRFDISQSVSGFVLVIKDCQVEDSGKYKCEATNKAATIDTSAKVTVQGECGQYS